MMTTAMQRLQFTKDTLAQGGIRLTLANQLVEMNERLEAF